jgi:hypothetical protein
MIVKDAKNIIFRRVKGRIVPIRQEKEIKANKSLAAVAAISSVASGVLSGATIASGGKKFWFGQTGSLGLDILSSSANVAAYAGKDRLGSRTGKAAKSEFRNQLIGYGAFGATVLLNPHARKKGVQFAQLGLSTIRSFLGRVL